MSANQTAAAKQKRLEEQISNYFLTVTGATLTFMVIAAASMFYDGTASTVPYPERAWQLAVLTAFLGMACWFFTVFAAIVPFNVTLKIADRYKITNVFYYLACGALTGIFTTALFVWIWPGWYSDPPEQTGFTLFNRFTGFSVTSGIVGGFLYWWKAVRR